MQNAFFEAGPLHECRSDLVSRTHTLLEWARERQLLVVNVRTEHRADRSTWTLNMLEDDQGFAMEGDHKSPQPAELDLDGVTEVVKTRDEPFLGTPLEELLRGPRNRPLNGKSVGTG